MDLKNVIDGDFEEVVDENYKEKKKEFDKKVKEELKAEKKARKEKKAAKKKARKERQEELKNSGSRIKRFLGRFRISAVLIAIVILVLGFLYVMNDYYIDFLWFKEVGYVDIFLKELTTKIFFGLPFFLIVTVISFVYFEFVFRIIRTGYNKVGSFGKFAKVIITLGYSVSVSGLFIYKLWYKYLEFKGAANFNQVDSLFGKDISFYVFKLPFFMTLTKVLFVSVLGLFLITMLIFFTLRVTGKKNPYIENNKREQRRDQLNFFYKVWDYVKIPCSIFMALMFILVGIYSYLSMFNVLYSSSGIVYGATYTDVAITVNVHRFITVLCMLCGVFSIIFGLRNKLKPIIVCVCIIPLIYLASSMVSSVVQNYYVIPNEYVKEQSYIENNIEMTRKAYNIDDAKVEKISASNTLTSADIKANATTINNIPINDFGSSLDIYNSLQSFRSYYTFNDVDVDRYTLDKVATQVFISIREMDSGDEDNVRTWVNKHKKYTHGYGAVVSPVTEVNESGQPVLIEKDIPATTVYDNLKLVEPRIYYGEKTYEYAIVNCKSNEFDYPDGDDNKENQYKGKGGISLSFYNRIAFSISNMSSRILLSTDINGDSKILINRQILDRVKKIAPFLDYDNDPYIVNANGKLYWIIDAFTTSSKYPYSTPAQFENGKKFNYIRNSIKVVIDAYNGDVNFYQIDSKDPMATAYANIYKGFLKPISKMNKEVRKHLRYSEVLFKVQSEMYENYHMTNSQTFYNKEDQWQVAKQFYGTEKKSVNVNFSYQIMKLPGSSNEQFIIMAPFTPKGKNNMIAWMGGICDGKDYGKLRVYQLPKQKLIYGPMQIEQRIDQDTVIAPQLNLLSQVSSSVSRGNMLTIPIGDSFLYVEPIYVKSSTTETGLPEVKEVVVAYGNKIVMKGSLSEAIDAIFNLGEGAEKTVEKSVEDAVNEAVKKTDTSGNSVQLEKQARDLLKKAKRAQAEGNTKAYKKYMAQLEKVLDSISEK